MEKCFTRRPDDRSVRAETWLAIAAGARGIGYFPDVWEQPIRDTITSINRDIVSLVARAARHRRAGASSAPWSTIRAGVRRHNGAVYVIAVNSSTNPTTGRILVSGLGDRQLEVFGENRTSTPQLSQISTASKGSASTSTSLHRPAGSRSGRHEADAGAAASRRVEQPVGCAPCRRLR